MARYEHLYGILEIMPEVQPQEGGARPSPGQRHQDYRELYGRARTQHPRMLGLPLRVAVRGIPFTGCQGLQGAGTCGNNRNNENGIPFSAAPARPQPDGCRLIGAKHCVGRPPSTVTRASAESCNGDHVRFGALAQDGRNP